MFILNLIYNLKIMKNKILLLLSFLFISSVYADTTLTQSQVSERENNWYVISDPYTSSSLCLSNRDIYNQQYSSYTRSECFYYNNSYYYFLCSWTSCNLDWSSSYSSTSYTTTQANSETSSSVPNKAKLDIFLSRIEGLNNTSNFQSTLDTILAKINTLWNKYSSNTTVTQMVTYLKNWINNIKQRYTTNNEVDSFFCELTDSCNTSSNSSSSSSNTSWNSSNSSSPSYVNLVNWNWITACNRQILDKFWTQRYSCSIWWWCSVNWLPPTSTNPSANPTIVGACIPYSEWTNPWVTTSSSSSLSTIPNLSVDKTIIMIWWSVVFTWNSNWWTNCYAKVNNNFNWNLEWTWWIIEVNSVQTAWLYANKVICKYNWIEKSSNIINVTVWDLVWELNRIVETWTTDWHVYARWIIQKEAEWYTEVRELVSRISNWILLLDKINEFLRVNYWK